MGKRDLHIKKMHMKKMSGLLLSAIFFLSACSSHQKKVLVYADSKIQVDESQKNIVVEDGTTQVEQELNFNSGDPVVLNISGPNGKYTLEIKEDGLFLANLKKDTVVGSMQHTGESRHTRITQQELRTQLDSLNKLIKGENISATAKNYFIPPGHVLKISNLTNAKIFGPYQPVPSAFDASSVPEIYKFYSLSEEKEIIAKLTEMSKYKYEKGDEKGNGKVPEDDDDSVYTIHPTKK
jgi:cell division protein YceG involved in septum cleavage